jgi:hypothetical protein
MTKVHADPVSMSPEGETAPAAHERGRETGAYLPSFVMTNTWRANGLQSVGRGRSEQVSS